MKHINDDLAFYFCEAMLSEVGKNTLSLINLLNQDDGFAYDVCHSHDFCDANEVMLQAWRETFGDVYHDSENNLACWNATWHACKRASFNAQKFKS